MFYKRLIVLGLVVYFTCFNTVFAGVCLEPLEENTKNNTDIERKFLEGVKYPDFSHVFVGEDRWENFNRKMFNFNLRLNRYAIRPVHIIWSSIMPEFGMDRIQSATNNIEYPIRLVSCLIQKDFQSAKSETVRFLMNTTIGVGGLFDPAKVLFHIYSSKENMEQALAGCKMKTGPYIVLPVISSTTLRGMLGKLLDMALNPGSYIATPVLAIVKAGLTINRTSYMQPVIKMVESTFADPYEIAKKAYGIDSYIKCANLDRVDLKKHLPEVVSKPKSDLVQNRQILDTNKVVAKTVNNNIVKVEVSSEILAPNLLYGGTNIDDELKNYSTEDFKLGADIILPEYNPQTPVVDSMRTALFNLPDVNKSIWNELSIWNRSFSKRIRTASVNVTQGRQDYKFRYILQKDKNSPLAIVYPSIGEGINSVHSVLIAKLFYDAGYSVIILGSHFQWEFVKSMPDGFKPGLPANDAKMLRDLTYKIIVNLENRYERSFEDKVFIGTSFGALISLFVANLEYKSNTFGNAKFISVCPPVELIYAMKQIDKNTDEWDKSPENLKQKVALVAAKVMKLYESKDEDINGISLEDIKVLPFTDEEGKLITGFIMHQKLSDLIFTIEKVSKSEKSEVYKMINNMNYQDYTNKYLLSDKDESCDDLSYEVSLHSISEFLQNSDNYKIYHSLNDYLTNTSQLKRLKQYSGDKSIYFDNGAHLGFLYRQEFINDLKDTISQFKPKNVELVIPEINPNP